MSSDTFYVMVICTRGGSRNRDHSILRPDCELALKCRSTVSAPHPISAEEGGRAVGKDAQKACVCSLDASAKSSYNILPQTGKPKVHAILVG